MDQMVEDLGLDVDAASGTLRRGRRVGNGAERETWEVQLRDSEEDMPGSASSTEDDEAMRFRPSDFCAHTDCVDPQCGMAGVRRRGEQEEVRSQSSDDVLGSARSIERQRGSGWSRCLAGHALRRFRMPHGCICDVCEEMQGEDEAVWCCR